MKKKAYKITFDLKEGYDVDGKVHSLDEVGKIAAEWMTERLEKGLPVVSGFLQTGQLLYPTVGDIRDQHPVTLNPSAVFMGELSSVKDLKRKNSEIRLTLESLAKLLKNKLNQEAVYIIFKKRNWCV